MSTPLHHFCNREFLEEVNDLKERNVLLLMIDGSAVFGRLACCNRDDCVVRIVPATGIAGVLGVLFRPPAETLVAPIIVNEIYIDVCDIAHIIEGPFIVPPIV